MKKLGSWLVPYLLAMLITFEGLALMVFAREVELVDVLVLDQLLVMVIGAVLLIMGLLLFVSAFPQIQKMGEWLVKRLQVTAAVAVLAISLIFLVLAAPVNVDGVDQIGKEWVVLVAAQLFLLGSMSFVYLNYEPLADRRLAWMEWLGLFASCLVMTEGAVIFGLRGDLNIHGQLRTGPELMIVFSVLLVAMGIVELVIFNLRQEGQSEKTLGMLDWAGMGVSIIIGAIGLVIILVATSMTLDGRTYGILWLLLTGLLLVLLGSLLNYTQTVVGQREGLVMDLGLVTTIAMLIAIPIVAAF